MGRFFILPTHPLNVPHVAPIILHYLYPRILLWAADLVATPQHKCPAWSPTHVNV